MSVTSWFLVSSCGTRHRLPREMIFVGRDECELMLQSRSVDKQHAVINYDDGRDEHRVKDLGSLNGTFVNDVRIPDQKYITLNLNDVIRFGYDVNMYVLEHIQHKLPEEALKHEKYTSQLQMSLKAPGASRAEHIKEHKAHTESSQAKQEKGDKKAANEPSVYRTPLYGQPSWWGDDEANNKHEKHEGRRQDEHYSERSKDQHEEELNGNIVYRDSQDQSVYSFRREPSYFEIPTKDFQQPAKPTETQLHEIPTKDTDTITAPVVQSHASFTIEFDDCRPGKIKIKDHVTKFSMRQKKLFGKESCPTETVSAESKVADWLVQNDPSLMRRPSPGEDVYSTKSDLPVHNRTLKGNRHDDGTQSDSEDPVVVKPAKETGTADQGKLQRQIKREPEDLLHSQQAFVIEFFDEDAPRKKRSQSFTQSANSSQNDTDPALKTSKLEKRKAPPPAEKLSTNGTLSSPPVAKPVASSSFPQRSNSFRREKTDDRINSSTSSTARPPVKNYGSVGRKSRLAEEFAAEYLREQTEALKQAAEKPMTLALSITTTTMQPAALQTQNAAPASTAATSASSPSDPRPLKAKHEEDDSLSDAGTYTIETETQDREVEEARKMIDQVFGVFEPEEYSRISSAVYRPVIKVEKQEPVTNERSVNPNTVTLPSHIINMNSEPQTETQTRSSGSASKGSQKWVSRWASLADSYPDASPTTSPLDSQKPGLTYEDGVDIDYTEFSGEADHTLPSRTRRLLPQLPPNDKSESPTPTILVCQESYSETTHKRVSEQQENEISSEPRSLLFIQEDLDPDSLSDASKSDDGAILNSKYKISKMSTNEWKNETSDSREPSAQRTSKITCEQKSTGFYVGNDNEIGSLSQANSGVLCMELHKEYKAHELHMKPKGNQHSTQETPIVARMVNQLQQGPLHKKENGSSRESVSFVRQESFTKEQSSSTVPLNKLPHIPTHPLLKDLDAAKKNHDYSQETRLILKETETALAALEAKLFAQTHIDELENVTCQQDDSLSGESDVDTASTVSIVSDKNVPTHPQKGRASSLQNKIASSTSSVHYGQPSARERLTEKRRTGPADGGSRGEVTKRFQMKRSTGTRGSSDFTDEERCSSLPSIPVTEIASSDYEHSSSRPLSRRRHFGQTTKEENGRNSLNAQKVQQALTRSNSLSTPRPTRASKLRRARLGDASDNESADLERSNVSPEVSSTNSSSAKSSAEAKKPSRLDILAMPRKRTGSFNVPSDTETSSARTGFSGRSSENSYTSRKPVMSDIKPPTKKPIAPTPKQPFNRAHSGSVKYSSSSTSRRRQQGSDYISTSEEEYGSNHSTPKHKRSHASTATQTPKAHGTSRRQKHNGHQDDDEQEVYNNFMAQSAEIAEIARLSQTLVKDVASLAREIHDVAGDGDSQSSSGTGHSTSLSSVPNTPASTISAREELVQHISEASLNYQKVPPGSMGFRDFDQNMNDSREEDPSKRRSRNREEVIFDNLMLNPVSQLSHTICANTETLTDKMKILFQNKEKTWEEMEAKIHSENEVPILKTSNKEISSILKELRRVQKQLEVINAVIDPTGHLDVITSNKKSSSAIQSSNPIARTTHSSAARKDTHPPVLARTYMQKSHSGSSSRSTESSFGRDLEDTYIV
ncbi:hypothetical protein FKM82_016961 [Ascaphus truei]